MFVGYVFVLVLIVCISFTNVFAFRMDEQAESLLYIQEAESAPEVPEVSKPSKSKEGAELSSLVDDIQSDVKSSAPSKHKKGKTNTKVAGSKHTSSKPDMNKFMDDDDFADLDDDFIVIDSDSLSIHKQGAGKHDSGMSSHNSSMQTQNTGRENVNRSAGIMGKIEGNSSPNIYGNPSMSKVEEEADKFFNDLLGESLDD